MGRILLLLQDERERAVSIETLSSHHEVITSLHHPPEEEFDLAILDLSNIRELREEITELREKAHPTFLPLLLLLSPREVLQVPEHLKREADGILTTPLVPAELMAWVNSLLRIRGLSLECHCISEAVPDPILVLKEDLTIISANQAFYELFQTTPQEILAKPISNLEKKGWDMASLFSFLKKAPLGDPLSGEFEAEIKLHGRKAFLRVRLRRITCQENPYLLLVIHDITPLVEDKRSLEEALKDWEKSFQSLSEGMALLGPRQRILKCNKAFLKTVGKREEELLGRPCWAITHKTNTPPPNCPFLKMRKTKKRETVEMQLGNKLFRVTVDPLLDDKNRITGAVHIMEDVTEQRIIEKRLKEREAFLTSIFESIQDGISVLDRDLTIKMVNPVINIWHACHVPLEGKKCYQVYQNRDKPCSPCPTLRCFQSGKTEMEIVAVPSDAGEKWIELYSYPLKDPDTGEVLGAIEFVRDITQRRKAEQERDRLITAIDYAGEAVVITDVEGNIQYVNPAFERITGYSREEILGQNPRILKSGKHDKNFYKELWNTITSGKTWTGRFINKKKDGTLYTEAATISPVFDKEGKIVNFVAVKRDVTEHLQLEEQLRQAQKMESIGRLAGGVAHDFNNTLGVIMGYAELALSKVGPHQQASQYLKEILAATQRAAEITRQLLAFARKQTISPKTLNLNETIEGMLKVLKRIIGEDIELTWIPGENLWPVNMDPTQVHQILINLVVNAKDAIEKSGEITVETFNVTLDAEYCAFHIEAHPGDFVVIAVSDTGKGMPQEVLEKIFEPFFTTKPEGTGLGLSTVYGIVKQNRGFINVYSEPGKGSTFKIYLPRCLSKEEKNARELEEELPRGRGETILLVEDDRDLLALCQTILEGLGYKVYPFSSPEEALENFEELPSPDMVITDVVMPGMSGKELVQKLQEIHPGLKVLYISGYTSNVIAHHGILEPGIQLLPKPFSTKELATKVRKVLGEKEL